MLDAIGERSRIVDRRHGQIQRILGAVGREWEERQIFRDIFWLDLEN
jgi:hypothetical protein